jgi:putative endonuclease
VKKYFVYILKCSDDTFYTGYTDDVVKRCKKHNSEKGAKYTKTRLPVEVVYSKEIGNKSQTMKEEHRIKQLTRKQKMCIISENYEKKK